MEKFAPWKDQSAERGRRLGQSDATNRRNAPTKHIWKLQHRLSHNGKWFSVIVAHVPVQTLHTWNERGVITTRKMGHRVDGQCWDVISDCSDRSIFAVCAITCLRLVQYNITYSRFIPSKLVYDYFIHRQYVAIFLCIFPFYRGRVISGRGEAFIYDFIKKGERLLLKGTVAWDGFFVTMHPILSRM
jgi:hypothetical protein